MGGGCHNRADVRSAPPQTVCQAWLCVGADLTSARLWHPPPITKSSRIRLDAPLETDCFTGYAGRRGMISRPTRSIWSIWPFR